jgi:DNA primase
MRFDDRLLEDIKARIPPSRLIGKSVQLQRAGASLKALSPFTKEKTPSFYVNDEKKIFKCFSSGLGGDIFKWLMLTEGLSFPEAVERLAAEAGLALPERDPETAARDHAKRALVDWLEAAQAFFAESLRAGLGKEARDYLARRGVPALDWSRFEIGYAPAGWEVLTQHLAKLGAKPKDLIAAGLAKESSRAGEPPYGYFRNRVTFAIRDPQGRLVGFGGRALAKDEKAKYINSPESDVFKKGEVLYRYPEARKAASASGHGGARPMVRRGLVIVEGYMDAIALAQAGVPETVASLGTAMTPEQIELAWRAGPRPTLLLDGDEAGIAAGYRVAERVLAKLEPGRTMRFARLQGAKDPDDLVRAEGIDGVRRVLDASESLDAILWEKVAQEHPVASPDDAAAFEAALKAQIAKIEHEGVRSHYRTELLARFNEAYGFRGRNRRSRGDFKGGRGRTPDMAPPLAVTRSRTQAERLAELRELRRLLHALMERPSILDGTTEILADLDVPDPALSALRDALVAAAEWGEAIDKLALERHFAEHGVDMTAAWLRDEWASAAAPALLREIETDEEALGLWTREAARVVARRHGRDERADLKSAALEGVEAGDRDVERRFITGAHELTRPRGEDSDHVGVEDAAQARARIESQLEAWDSDVKRLGDRRRSKR